MRTFDNIRKSISLPIFEKIKGFYFTPFNLHHPTAICESRKKNGKNRKIQIQKVL